MTPEPTTITHAAHDKPDRIKLTQQLMMVLMGAPAATAVACLSDALAYGCIQITAHHGEAQRQFDLLIPGIKATIDRNDAHVRSLRTHHAGVGRG